MLFCGIFHSLPMKCRTEGKCMHVQSLTCVRCFATPWIVACHFPRSMEFSRQEYWSGLPFPTPGDLPNQGSNSGLLQCRQILYHLSHQGSPERKWFLYLFPRATIINYRKFIRLKQWTFILSQFWQLEIQSQHISSAMVLLKALKQNSSLPLPKLLVAPGKP